MQDPTGTLQTRVGGVWCWTWSTTWGARLVTHIFLFPPILICKSVASLMQRRGGLLTAVSHECNSCDCCTIQCCSTGRLKLYCACSSFIRVTETRSQPACPRRLSSRTWFLSISPYLKLCMMRWYSHFSIIHSILSLRVSSGRKMPLRFGKIFSRRFFSAYKKTRPCFKVRVTE